MKHIDKHISMLKINTPLSASLYPINIYTDVISVDSKVGKLIILFTVMCDIHLIIFNMCVVSNFIWRIFLLNVAIH